jgi:hypothetical protein
MAEKIASPASEQIFVVKAVPTVFHLRCGIFR